MSSDDRAWMFGTLVIAGLGLAVLFGIGHRKPCQMHLPSVTMGDEHQ